MGWLLMEGQTRPQLIERRTRPWSNQGVSARCLAHACVGNVLWTVWERTLTDGKTDRWIGCDLMRCDRGYGWGYKDMEESMHPYYYSCPERYLEMVPPACEEWRRRVHDHHTRRAAARARLRTLKIGDTITLASRRVPEVTIVSLRPLCGEYGGTRYRIPRRLLVQAGS